MGKKNTIPLGETDLELGDYVSGYRYCSPIQIRNGDVFYIAARHAIQYRVVLPNGPQGYCTVSLPGNVKTLDQALRYLARTEKFKLK